MSKNTNSFSMQIVNAAFQEDNRKLRGEQEDQWMKTMFGWEPPTRADFFQMFHFWEKQEEPEQLTATVAVEQPSNKPCKFLSEAVRESKETGQLTGTHEACAHPNHQTLGRIQIGCV